MYTKIQNPVDSDNIDKIIEWINKYPIINNDDYSITELIDGDAISIVVNASTVTFCNKDGIIPKGSNYMNYRAAMQDKRVIEMLSFLILLSKLIGNKEGKKKVFQLNGVIYGDNSKKIDYGVHSDFRWHSMFIDGKYNAPSETDNLMEHFLDLKVPTIGLVNPNDCSSIFDMIHGLDSIFRSGVTVDNGDSQYYHMAKGLVLTPYYSIINSYASSEEEIFYIKKEAV